jgi:hypothetical protein
VATDFDKPGATMINLSVAAEIIVTRVLSEAVVNKRVVLEPGDAIGSHQWWNLGIGKA